MKFITDRILGFWALGIFVTWYESSSTFRAWADYISWKVLDIIEGSELAQKTIELNNDYSNITLICWAILAYLGGQGAIMTKNYLTENKFKDKNYNTTINFSATQFIDSENTIKIQNEMEADLAALFPHDIVSRKKILEAAKRTSAEKFILDFKNLQDGWQIYERIRDHAEILWRKIDVFQADSCRLQREKWIPSRVSRPTLLNSILHTPEKLKGVDIDSLPQSLELDWSTGSIEYIWCLTQWPQYTVTETKELREKERGDAPHTKAQIRFPAFPIHEFESAVLFFENMAKMTGENVNDIVDKVCLDCDSCCKLTDEFIRYMLDIDERENDKVSDLFKYPTYRTRIVILAQLVREVKNKKPHLKFRVAA